MQHHASVLQLRPRADGAGAEWVQTPAPAARVAPLALPTPCGDDGDLACAPVVPLGLYQSLLRTAQPGSRIEEFLDELEGAWGRVQPCLQRRAPQAGVPMGVGLPGRPNRAHRLSSSAPEHRARRPVRRGLQPAA